MGFEAFSFSNKKKKNEKIVLTPAEQKEALAAGLGAGAREAALERKPDGFERVHKTHKSKKEYRRQEKHKKNW